MLLSAAYPFVYQVIQHDDDDDDCMHMHSLFPHEPNNFRSK